MGNLLTLLLSVMIFADKHPNFTSASCLDACSVELCLDRFLLVYAPSKKEQALVGAVSGDCETSLHLT